MSDYDIKHLRGALYLGTQLASLNLDDEADKTFDLIEKILEKDSIGEIDAGLLALFGGSDSKMKPIKRSRQSRSYANGFDKMLRR